MVDDTVSLALERCRDTLRAATQVFIGFSGGLDSTVLLHATRALLSSGVPDANLVALHANHGLHGDAALWEAHCAKICAQLTVPCRSKILHVEASGRGLEAAARDARFAWFAEHLGAGDLLLLAHHQDDQAETLLLRLLRGAGPDGLSAIPPARDLGAGRVVRPLLPVPRSELARYAQRHRLSWIDDPSNDDDTYDRNYLRRRVLPVLEARWPAYREVLSRTADLLREAAAERINLAPATCFSATGDPGFACTDLPAEPAAAALAVRAWLRQWGLPMPGRLRLGEFLRQLRGAGGASLATDAWVLTRFRDAVYVHGREMDAPTGEALLMLDEELDLQDCGRIALIARESAEDVPVRDPGARKRGIFVLRWRRSGERLATASGQHRDLKKVFQEAGVPPWWRSRVPLVYERREDREELIAVGSFAFAPRLGELGLRVSWTPQGLGP